MAGAPPYNKIPVCTPEVKCVLKKMKNLSEVIQGVLRSDLPFTPLQMAEEGGRERQAWRFVDIGEWPRQTPPRD